jgi:transmembrane sensor
MEATMTDPPGPADKIDAQAISWVIRAGDSDFDDWDAFERWLAESPANAAAYHAAATAEAEIVETLAAGGRQPAEAPAPRPAWHRAGWVGGALAASLLLVFGVASWRPAAPSRIFETGPGQHRAIALADGSRIALNGNTRLTMTAHDERAIELERGEALFTVHHDSARPFSVTVAGATISDVGTVFNVVRDQGATRVSVAEGVVVWNPTREAVRLGAGKRLRAEDDSQTLELAQVDVAAVGGWARGWLSYDGTPLGTVAADVSRALGVKVAVTPMVASRPVRGVLRLDGGANVVMPRLGALLGVRARFDGHVWRLSSPP